MLIYQTHSTLYDPPIITGLLIAVNFAVAMATATVCPKREMTTRCGTAMGFPRSNG